MALREVLVEYGFEFDDRAIARAREGITGFAEVVTNLGSEIINSPVVTHIREFATEMVEAGSEINKVSAALGISYHEWQQWATAAGLAGVESDAVRTSMHDLGRNALAAVSGSAQAKKMFADLGVTLETADGKMRPVNELFRDTGISIATMGDSTRATATAQVLMGESAGALLPIFANGEAGLNDLLGVLDQYGGGMSDKAVPATLAMADSFAQWEVMSNSIRGHLAAALLPILSRLMTATAKVGAGLSRLLESTSAVQTVMVLLGGAMAKMAIAKFGGSLLSLGKLAILPAIKLALLIFLIDDLAALMGGRASVIGAGIDKIFGIGSAAKLIAFIKEIGNEFEGLGKLKWWQDTAEGIALLTSDMNAFWRGVFAQMGIDVATWVASTGQAFSLVGSDIGQWASDSIARMGEIATEFRDGAIQLGVDLINGVVQGLKDGASAVINALGGVMDDAMAGAKARLGIESPSKVAAATIGTPVIQGVVEGLTQGAGAVEAASRQTLALAAAPLSPAAAGIAPAGAGVRNGGGQRIEIRNEINLTVNAPTTDAQTRRLSREVRGGVQSGMNASLAALRQRAPA